MVRSYVVIFHLVEKRSRDRDGREGGEGGREGRAGKRKKQDAADFPHATMMERVRREAWRQAGREGGGG